MVHLEHALLHFRALEVKVGVETAQAVVVVVVVVFVDHNLQAKVLEVVGVHCLK